MKGDLVEIGNPLIREIPCKGKSLIRYIMLWYNIIYYALSRFALLCYLLF